MQEVLKKIKTISNANLNDEFEIVLDILQPHYVYGYGYGLTASSFILSSSDDPYDKTYPSDLKYFNVLNLDGFNTGFGISGTASTYIGSYSYGWGYETSPLLSGNLSNSANIQATVSNNGAAVSGVTVIFSGGPGIKFSSNSGVTNGSGKVVVSVEIDSSAKMNIDTNGGNPELVDRFALGYMEIVAAIDKMPSVNDSVLTIKTVSDQLFWRSE